MNKYLIIIIIFIISATVGGFFWYKNYKSNSQPTNSQSTNQTNPTPTTNNSQLTTNNQLTLPIAEFKDRITKKPFGIYITPSTSPVQPERFSGYHTGVDVEYQDVETDVPVYAINDGAVELAKTVSGYGGVIIIKTKINGYDHSILYGHIRPPSLPKLDQTVNKSEQIGVLGTGYSAETDGERKHLHFSILADERMDLRGYLQNQSELSGWLDPLSLF